MKNSLAFSEKILYMYLTYNTPIVLPGIFPREMKNLSTQMCTHLSTAALSVIEKKKLETNRMSFNGEWLNKLCIPIQWNATQPKKGINS